MQSIVFFLCQQSRSYPQFSLRRPRRAQKRTSASLLQLISLSNKPEISESQGYAGERGVLPFAQSIGFARADCARLPLSPGSVDVATWHSRRPSKTQEFQLQPLTLPHNVVVPAAPVPPKPLLYKRCFAIYLMADSMGLKL